LGRSKPDEETLAELYGAYFANKGLVPPEENVQLLVRAALFAANHRIGKDRDDAIFDERSKAFYSRRKTMQELTTTPFDLEGQDLEELLLVEIDIDRAEIEAYYAGLGMEVSFEEDEPDAVYPLHSHDHDVRLLTLQGSVLIRQGDREWEDLRAGSERFIPVGTEHEARAGQYGWKYAYARPVDSEPQE